jgi:hypothetical protein
MLFGLVGRTWELYKFIGECLQPPFYSRDHKEMYERIVNQPLRVSNVVSVSARDILHSVSVIASDESRSPTCPRC